MRRSMLFPLLLTLLLCRVASADSALDIQNWLSRPGVRAVAVEFYATWCKPCMEAMPRWKKLRELYGRDGFRVIVVNTRDSSGSCATLGWKPDDYVCDIDGVLADDFGVTDRLPAAFLWDWQGNLQVQNGHITAVESGVEAIFKHLPRLDVQAGKGIPPALETELRNYLTNTGKMVVVADEATREAMSKARLAQYRDDVNEEARCEIGKEVPANALLKVARVNGGRNEYLALEVYDLEKGCQQVSTTVAWDPVDLRGMARDGVENLLSKLRHPLEKPHGRASVTAANPRSDAQKLATLVITSDVEGADIVIDGRPQPQPAGAKAVELNLPPGSRQVKISKSGYLDDVRTVMLAAGRRVEVSAHLEAEKRAEAPRSESMASSAVTVKSQPKGAVFSVDGQKMGKTPRTVEVAPGKHRIDVSLEWYLDATTEVSVEPGGFSTVELALKPNYAEVEVVTDPPQATVFLDGRQVGVTDPTVTLTRVPPGKHVFRATKPNYHEAESSADVVAGKPLQVKIPALKSSVGALRITSTPAGAEVEIDRQSRGSTPLTVESLADGPHELRLTLSNHDDWEGTVSVAEGQTRTQSVALESQLGTLEVRSTPPGQPLVVDGNLRGSTPQRLTLQEGQHTVRVGESNAAYSMREEKLVILRGKTRTLDWTLEELFGRLVVFTDPPEAVVSIDGREQGKAPVSLPKVRVGSYRIEARLEGHRPASGQARVEAGEETKLRLELQEIAVPAVKSYEPPPESPRPVSGVQGKCPAGFVMIPSGTFTMGSENDSEAWDSEKPAHRVTVSGFCLARTEVTQADWESVMGNNPSYFKGADRPVEQVSWNDAVVYCNRRSQREGLRPVYGRDGSVDRRANGYRLPTEAEWEYAARGGSSAPRYGDLDSIAWYSGNSGSQTHDVGQKRPNSYGLYDMLGNVWEWTQDRYGGYSAGSQTDPQGPASGSYRVLRGGGWDDVASGARAGDRTDDAPDYRFNYVGFRPLRSLP